MTSPIRVAATLLVVLLAFAGIGPADAQQPIKPGLWHFTASAPVLPFRLSGLAQAEPRGGDSFTKCIDPARSVPTDPRMACRIDGMQRSGTTVSWTTTCSLPQGAFRSRGVAQYSGNAMSGTMTTEVPILGRPLTQQISGRYLGPCAR